MIQFHYQWVVVLAMVAVGGNATASFLYDQFPAEVIEESQMDTAELISKYKYPVETHFVTTADNYILRLHRIPRPDARPVLLMHGLLDCSVTWVIMGPWSSLGYYLYDLGYDVWMGNVRGNRYSRNHTTLNPDSSKAYWNFSWHEIGYYDLPAKIDYILGVTGRTKLTYFGHSQGTTSFFVMCSTRPKYNEKIIMMHALAPVTYSTHVKNSLRGMVVNLGALLKGWTTEVLPHTNLTMSYCFQSQRTLDLCIDTFWLVMGKDVKQTNATMWPVVFGLEPNGCAIKQCLHYMQLTLTDRFTRFDHGPKENMRRYGKSTPPDYPLEKVTARIGLYYSYNDMLSSEVDVQRLAKRLPNVVEDILYPHRSWNHMTVVWGIEARDLAHNRMIEVMRRYED